MPDRVNVEVKRGDMSPISVELVVSKLTKYKVVYKDPDDPQLSVYLRKEDVNYPNHPQRVRLMIEAVA